MSQLPFPHVRRLGALVCAGVLAVLSLTVLTDSSAGATSAPRPLGSSTIGPGVQMMTPVGQGEYEQCTANFVYRSVSYATRTVNGRRVRVAIPHVYVGMAAHCVGAPSNSNTDTNGCTSGSLPLGQTVYFYQGVSGGSTLLGLVSLSNGSNGHRIGFGTLRYSSWLSMQKSHTADAATCAYNDLALVEVNSRYLRQVNPTVPWFGGPTKLAPLPGVPHYVYTVGNSSLRGTERSTSGSANSHSLWSDLVTTQDTGVPGDSGSGYMNSAGEAIGVLSTLDCSDPIGLSCTQNGIGSLAEEVAFARSHGLPTLTLVPGTARFNAAGSGHSTGSGNSSLLGGLGSGLGL